VDLITYKALEDLRTATKAKSIGAVLSSLIEQHPTSQTTDTAHADSDDEEDLTEVLAVVGEGSISVQDATRISVVSRLVVEGSVSLNKMPLVVDLVKKLLEVSDSETFSCSKYDRLFKKAFDFDLALLKDFFTLADRVHLKPDCSTRQGQERLSVFLTCWRAGVPVERLIYSGALESKTGVDQLAALIEVLVQLDVLDKLVALTSDAGKDVCAGNGLFGLLEKELKRELLRIECDLHMLNRGFVVAGESTFGKPQKDVPSVFQLLFLVPYSLKPWTKFKPLLARHIVLQPDEALTMCPDSINTRWYTVVEAAFFTDLRAEALIALGREVSSLCRCFIFLCPPPPLLVALVFHVVLRLWPVLSHSGAQIVDAGEHLALK